jgi:hypothetical protein
MMVSDVASEVFVIRGIVFLIIVWFSLMMHVVASSDSNAKSGRLPIVYVYTIVPAACQRGLPPYIKETLEHVVLTQPDCDVILASNYKSCPAVKDIADTIGGIIKIDVEANPSPRTIQFISVSLNMFGNDGGHELWLTSAYRFFYLEEIMKSHNYAELVHAEADNLLYGKLTTALPDLRQHYKGIATTPLSGNRVFITASVFWVGSLQGMLQFNDYLLELGTNVSSWKGYLRWLRPYACCKQGGTDQDEHGNGIKPFAVNEMSMLGYYHVLYPERFKLFPVVPEFEYVYFKHIVDLHQFAPNGSLVGGPTGGQIWDAGSWGQFLGGTAVHSGNDKRFSDPSHVAGQAMRVDRCRPHMLCANTSLFWRTTYDALGLTNDPQKMCLTAPFVRCTLGYESNPEDAVWTPLWNLHVHSKHTKDFRSVPCRCQPFRTPEFFKHDKR